MTIISSAPACQAVVIHLAGTPYVLATATRDWIAQAVVTRVPGARAPFCGVTPQAGNLVPVVDLFACFGRPRPEHCGMLVTMWNGEPIGLLMDAVVPEPVRPDGAQGASLGLDELLALASARRGE
ncbi:MAG TPA: chemotaxis protein CheW [Oscillatoriaceae cyanobacterium]